MRMAVFSELDGLATSLVGESHQLSVGDSAPLWIDQSQVAPLRLGLAAVDPFVDVAVSDPAARLASGLHTSQHESRTQHQGHRDDHCQRDQHLAGPHRLNRPGIKRPSYLGNYFYRCQNIALSFRSLVFEVF